MPTRYYHLPIEAGEAAGDGGEPVSWAASPNLPGAYAEAATGAGARDALRVLTRRIIAEHLLRDDALDPEIAVSEDAPHAEDGRGTLVVEVGDADLAEARAAPMLVIEQPEP
jgi:hypothetical protein